MNLRSGTSLWQSFDAPPVPPSTLANDLACEVAIVGGGITGALVAHFLLREGVDAVLLDKRAPTAGSTAASTGLLQYEVDTPLSELIRKVGEAPAVRSYRLGLLAIDEIERIAASLAEDCGFARRSSLYLASSEEDVKDLRAEYECRAHFGFDVAYLSQGDLAQIASFTAPATIRSTGDAQIDPLRFTQGLLADARGKGLRTYADCRVTELNARGDRIELTTPRAKVLARRVVVATGYEAHQMLRQDLGSLHSTYATASAPITDFAGWPDQCLIWETARPYFYLRAAADGRAIAGGGDTDYHDDHERDGLVMEKIARLRDRFERMFPCIPFEPEFAWAGTFAETKDGLAYIGESPERANTYFALGYGGNGITFSAIAARIITDLFVGRPNPDAHIFRFDR